MGGSLSSVPQLALRLSKRGRYLLLLGVVLAASGLFLPQPSLSWHEVHAEGCGAFPGLTVPTSYALASDSTSLFVRWWAVGNSVDSFTIILPGPNITLFLHGVSGSFEVDAPGNQVQMTTPYSSPCGNGGVDIVFQSYGPIVPLD